VNLPAIMHADLTGRPRPECGRTRTCLDWVHPKDVLAARAHGITMAEWLTWLWRTHPVKGVWRWDDPGPLLGMVAVQIRDATLRSSAPD
jgi:D-aspartate ligase